MVEGHGLQAYTHTGYPNPLLLQLLFVTTALEYIYKVGRELKTSQEVGLAVGTNQAERLNVHDQEIRAVCSRMTLSG